MPKFKPSTSNNAIFGSQFSTTYNGMTYFFVKEIRAVLFDRLTGLYTYTVFATVIFTTRYNRN